MTGAGGLRPHQGRQESVDPGATSTSMQFSEGSWRESRGVQAELQALGLSKWRARSLQRSNGTLHLWLVRVVPWILFGGALLGTLVFHTLQFVGARDEPAWALDVRVSASFPMPSMLLCSNSSNMAVQNYLWHSRNGEGLPFFFPPGSVRWFPMDTAEAPTRNCTVVDSAAVSPDIHAVFQAPAASSSLNVFAWATFVHIPREDTSTLTSFLFYPASPQQVSWCVRHALSFRFSESFLSCVSQSPRSFVQIPVFAWQYPNIKLTPALYRPLSGASHWTMSTDTFLSSLPPPSPPLPPGVDAWAVSWHVRGTDYFCYREEYDISLSALFVNYFVSVSVSLTTLSIASLVMARLFFWVAKRRARAEAHHHHKSALYHEFSGGEELL